MSNPAIIAAGGNPVFLDEVGVHLAERYERHYRIECPGSAAAAADLFQQFADDGVDVALVLTAQSALGTADAELLDLARRLHPQAKRALVVSPYAWLEPGGGADIRATMSLGRIDHFVVAPGPAPDEVFHEAISSFLLEWARERLLVPHTVNLVGEDWSGAPTSCVRCSRPARCRTASAWPIPISGRELLALAGPTPGCR